MYMYLKRKQYNCNANIHSIENKERMKEEIEKCWSVKNVTLHLTVC